MHLQGEQTLAPNKVSKSPPLNLESYSEKIAEVFVAEGAKAVLAGRRTAEGTALEQRLGANASFIRTDVLQEAAVHAMVEHTVQRFGRVDVLVNNAGMTAQVVGITEVDMAHFDQVMGVNIRGVVLCMKYAARVMVPQGRGSIVNVSSLAGTRGGFTSHPYGVSKGALLAVTRSVATELGEKGIRVNAISPGGIVTGIFAKNAGVEGAKADRVAAAVREVFATLQPIPRAGETEDVARAAVFLASDAAGFINGHDLVIDGGLSMAAVGWSEGLALRSELGRRIHAAAASLEA
jgi:NAD(P)-dependent dehydrogenase (short-subunit alcohol dehydrogenase family)